MTDWPSVHERVMDTFTEGWAQPHPHAWDEFLHEDVQFIQPMLRDGRGREIWWDEAARLLELVPDLRGEVLHWAGVDDRLYIDVRFTATLGGRPLEWRAIDVLYIDADGRLLCRESFFDAGRLAADVLTRPRAWRAWWRSGIAPIAGRRRLIRR